NIPDFRSAERTFSLINQASGRAGRSDLRGEVIVQTFNPEHYSIALTDYKSFYKNEIDIRKKLNYPPFCNIALLKISSANLNLAREEAEKTAKYLKENLDLDILGPAPSSMFKIKDNYYFQIIIKYRSKKEIIKEIRFLNEYYLKQNKVSFYIDFNPLII
ncbi:MAG: hypothetical protein AB1Z17_01915, partial [Lutibacter sp.]